MSWTFNNSRAISVKPPLDGKPNVINRLHAKKLYDFLGDACVPSYNLSTPGISSPNDKWRIVCRSPSELYVVVMAINMQEGDYLQVRRRVLTGTSRQFQALYLKLNSILIGHIRNESRKGDEEDSSFRLAYFCASELLLLLLLLLLCCCN